MRDWPSYCMCVWLTHITESRFRAEIKVPNFLGPGSGAQPDFLGPGSGAQPGPIVIPRC